MFDTSSTVNATLPGNKVVRMKFPTDADWTARNAARKVSQRQLGREIQVSTSSSDDVDVKIYERCRLEGSADLEPAEVALILDKLSGIEVRDVEHQGDSILVSMEAVGGHSVSHRLAVPNAQQIRQLTESGVRTVVVDRQTKSVVQFKVFESLWSELKLETDGYVNGVPVIHKIVAVRNAIDAAEKVVDDGFSF